jgi:hypothetical protein
MIWETFKKLKWAFILFICWIVILFVASNWAKAEDVRFIDLTTGTYNMTCETMGQEITIPGGVDNISRISTRVQSTDTDVIFYLDIYKNDSFIYQASAIYNGGYAMHFYLTGNEIAVEENDVIKMIISNENNTDYSWAGNWYGTSNYNYQGYCDGVETVGYMGGPHNFYLQMYKDDEWVAPPTVYIEAINPIGTEESPAVVNNNVVDFVVEYVNPNWDYKYLTLTLFKSGESVGSEFLLAAKPTDYSFTSLGGTVIEYPDEINYATFTIIIPSTGLWEYSLNMFKATNPNSPGRDYLGSTDFEYFTVNEKTTYQEEELQDIPYTDGVYISENNNCFLDEPCYLDIFYTESRQGQNMELYLTSDLIDPIATSTLPTNKTTYNFPVGTFSATGLYYFNAYIAEPLSAVNMAIIENIKINIYNKDEFDDEGQFLTDYNIESACDDVATSTGSFASDIRYGIECGIRKTLYWTFTPQTETKLKLQDSNESLKKNFPFNLYTDTRKIFSDIKDKTTATGTAIVMGDLIKWGDTQTQDTLNNTVFFSNETISSGLSGAWTTIYNSIISIIYTLLIFYILSDLLNLTIGFGAGSAKLNIDEIRSEKGERKKRIRKGEKKIKSVNKFIKRNNY